jgi:hypothetical protein
MISLRKSRYRGRVIVGPTQHLLSANRTKSHVGLLEKRRFRRFQVPKNAFALLNGPDGRLGRITDISKDGLAFRYVGKGEPPKRSFQMDILLANNGFRLEKVSFRTVSDFEVSKPGLANFLIMRRRGVQFDGLDQNYVSRLEYFIKNYALGAVS